VPKVIDFGIAKATCQSLTEQMLFTHFAQMVGTPLYMRVNMRRLAKKLPFAVKEQTGSAVIS